MRGGVLAKKKGRLSRTAAPDGSGCQTLLLFDDVRAVEGLEPEQGAAAIHDAAVDRIIDHLKLTFVAEKLPPSRVLTKVALMAAEQRMGRYGDRGDTGTGQDN